MTESATIQPPTLFNVLLIGDRCFDNYKIGTVDRLSPEAPVPVIKVVESFSLPGMSANVLKNFESLGIYPDYVSNTETITKTRFIDKRSGQHLLRVDDEHKLLPWNGRTSLFLTDYDAVVISDYDKGFLTYEQIEYIIERVRCPVFIDTKKNNLSTFSRKNVYVKINEHEFKNLISYSGNVIVTLGDRGAMLKSTQTETLFGTKPVEVMDVCGCGDTFLAALTTQYLYTKDIEKAIMFANVAAGITVQHRGNYAPSYDEIRNAGY